MAYVDLNPTRAGIAPTPEASDYTSIKERIEPSFNLAEAIKSYVAYGGFAEFFESEEPTPVRPLAAFVGEASKDEKFGISFEFRDYLELVDDTGRVIRDDKRGSINEKLPPILKRLGTTETDWVNGSQSFESLYYRRFRRKRPKKQVA